MAKTRDSYQLSAFTQEAINFVFARLTDRLDKLEGIRGTSDLTVGGLTGTTLTVNGNVYVYDADGELVHSMETA